MPDSPDTTIPSGGKRAAASSQPTGPLRWPPPGTELCPYERLQVMTRLLRLAMRGHAGVDFGPLDGDVFALACLASDLLIAIEELSPPAPAPGEPDGAV